ncbi:ATP-binding protein [Pelagicoccus sp. SDUM812003]|uniref:ATP-binding protein n=1 Tax=Pelagicoccus sp. SDUM812003 TaxID=3041267 RepID=UPI00280CE31A|nr:ATP-binding protein [Pelagicoccus sp. SDUM812003]MDQ8203123.1 ATP-binding protein [Pelagicoccus sp. SDUM812003]
MKSLFAHFSRSISARMFGGLSVMLALFVATVAIVLVMNSTQNSSSAAINDCGKLRMLSQRVAKASLLIADGDEFARGELMESVNEYESLLNGLVYGDPNRGLDRAEGRLAEQLERLRETWRDYRQRAEELVSNDADAMRFVRAKEAIVQSNTDLLEQANAIVSSLEAEATSKVDALLAVLYGLLVCGAVLFSGLVWALHRSLKPLKRLTSVSEKVAQGDFSTRASIRANDEVGVLGLAFDTMIEKIGRQISLLELTVSQLEEAKDHAEASMEKKSEMLAVMSHEIRAPLNGIIGMTNLLNQKVSNEEQKRYTEIVNVSGKALLEIIDDVLDFSKIEAGKLELNYGPFDLRTCVQEAVDIASYSASSKGLMMETRIAESVSPIVYGDQTRLRQVLINLLSNAVKFTRRGWVNVVVKEAASADGRSSNLMFSVEDTGVGFDEDEAERLFKFYSQANASTSRSYGGTGLGLAISKMLVEAMGGTIWVTSKPGKGTTFNFTIQADRKEQAEL